MARSLISGILLLFLLSPAALAAEREPLRIYTWVNYMPAWLLEDFTKETGIPINVSFFAENKALYRSLKEESALTRYDVVTPSAEMAQRLALEGLLQPLAHAKIPNILDLDPWFMDMAYDRGCKYSVPLFWGIVGLVIDKEVVPEAVASQIQGYKELWLPELNGKVMLPNDFRSIMSTMLLTLHYSVNDPSMEHITEAFRKYESLAPAVIAYDSVDQEETISKHTTGVAVAWGNMKFSESESNSRYQFVLPKEGSPMWVDTMVIPANAPNPEAAYAFINYVLRPEILARLSEEAGYAVAGKKAQELLPEALRNNTVVYPPVHMRYKLEAEAMFPPETAALEKEWIKIRDSR